MMHGWISGLVVIMKVMDHVLGFYFIRAMHSKRSRYNGSGGLKSAMYREASC